MATRIDIYLVEKGYVKSRERAKRAILEGRVLLGGIAIKKPSYLVEEWQDVSLRPDENEFVGQGGLKLLKALKTFPIDLAGRVCMDIGASTGGFSDCMLKHGAKEVYAVDVGNSQLDESLVKDPRVINLEKTDARTLKPEDYPCVSFISCDVSFISIKLILPTIASLIKDKGRAVILIKPQFEAGRAHIGKGGIVKDKKVHASVIADIIGSVAALNICARALTFSPVCHGNIEYLLWIDGKQSGTAVDKVTIQNVINEAEDYFRTT